MVKKRKKFLATLVAVFSLGYLGGEATRDGSEVNKFTTNPAHYVQKVYNQNYLDDLKGNFWSYKITRENDELKGFYHHLTSFHFHDMNEKKVEEFITTSRIVLKKIISIANTHDRGSKKYNEIINKVLPETKDYILKAIEIIEKQHSNHKELNELKKEIK